MDFKIFCKLEAKDIFMQKKLIIHVILDIIF